MSRVYPNPTPETLESMLHEPVEVTVRFPNTEEERSYRGVLHKREMHLIRAFGSHAPQLWHEPDSYEWVSIQRLEPHQITPQEQQEWMGFEPISVMLYVQFEMDKPSSLIF